MTMPSFVAFDTKYNEVVTIKLVMIHFSVCNMTTEAETSSMM
jgi:hypothetical protein